MCHANRSRGLSRFSSDENGTVPFGRTLAGIVAGLILAVCGGPARSDEATTLLLIYDEHAAAAPVEKGLPAAGKGERPAAQSAAPKGPDQTPPQAAAPKKPLPIKELSPALAALRDRVRPTLAALRQEPFNTRDSSPADVIHFCWAFGCDTEVLDATAAGAKLNGITCLCWNLPLGGGELLTVCDGHLAPRIGFGYQAGPSQLAAMLALARVPPEYPARAGETVRTVADLIEYEKLSCRSGADMSLKLIALSNYVRQATWKNSRGEEWSLARIVKEELARSVADTPHAATNRVLGLSIALDRLRRRDQPIVGDFLRAQQYVDESCDYALRAQNPDGSWNGAGRQDAAAVLAMTGHVLEWLVLTLPPARLESAPIVQSVQYVAEVLSSQRYRGSVPSLSSREMESVTRAAHALVVYDQRVFAPADPPPAPPEKPADAPAKQ